MIDLVTNVISLSTVGLHAVLVVGMILYFTGKGKQLFAWLGAHGMVLAFLLALAGVVGSLFYSEVAKFEPCVLCWWQRIFIYSNACILGLAIYRKDRAVLPYASLLVWIAGGVSLYHVLLPVLSTVSVTCSVFSGVSCSETYFTAFGYITIPVIALTSSVVMGVLLYLAKNYVPNK
jgi:disulfide bond formation protein DsbB